MKIHNNLFFPPRSYSFDTLKSKLRGLKPYFHQLYIYLNLEMKEIFKASMGFEPMASVLVLQCSTN